MNPIYADACLGEYLEAALDCKRLPLELPQDTVVRLKQRLDSQISGPIDFTASEFEHYCLEVSDAVPLKSVARVIERRYRRRGFIDGFLVITDQFFNLAMRRGDDRIVVSGCYVAQCRRLNVFVVDPDTPS